MENRKIAVVAAALILVGAGAFLYFRYRSAAVSPAEPPVEQVSLPQAKPAPAPPLRPEQAETFIRSRGPQISPSMRFQEWLKTDNIIRRITAAADIVAGGNTPKDSLDFLKPSGKFAVRKIRGKIYVDPRSYSRYDFIGDVFDSLDVAQSIQLYREVEPLLQQACREQGCWQLGMEATLIKAIAELLKTPVVVGNIRLRKKVLSYAMTDPALEGLSAAQKHLLRMGPGNTVKIQNKLREIARALGPADVQLPNSLTITSK